MVVHLFIIIRLLPPKRFNLLTAMPAIPTGAEPFNSKIEQADR